MALQLLLILILSMFAISDGAWCVCKQEAGTTALQKALDYACGAGADCSPILQNGKCYNPNTVKDHCSYAANSYYQRKGQAQQACDFAGAASLQTTDPSTAGCTYPADPSAAAGTASTTTGTGTTNFTSGIPSTFTPSTGVLGGLAPSGASSMYDNQSSPLRVPIIGPILLTVFISAMASLRI